jgi:exopolyphosphatase/guanosine-5'-triphosphate,3'-diphosphate pyrophosphatase
MAGFSQYEQLFLAALVRYHRRELSRAYARALPRRMNDFLRLLLLCLRLASVLCRSRDERAIPQFGLHLLDRHVRLALDPAWAMAHPLTVADLEAERSAMRVLGWKLELSLETGKPADRSHG